MPDFRRIRPKKKKTTLTHLSSNEPVFLKCPEVLVDFIFDLGLFFIEIKNIGSGSAHNISINFDKEIKGLGGQKIFSELPLFKSIGFMPPDKAIRTFLDKSDAYFSRHEPETISLKIHYQDKKGNSYSEKITHHLGIYRDLAFLVKPDMS